MSRGHSSEENSGSPRLEPEIRSAIENRVHQELARRAIAGSMVYFAVCVVVASSTTYYVGHPVALVLAAGLTLLAGGSRLLSARRVLSHPTGSLSRTALVFKGTTYATFVVWGLFCAWSVHWYPGEWTGMFLLLCTAVIAGGASSSLAPDFDLASRCLIILIGPTVVSMFLLGAGRYLWLAGLTGIYLVLLLARTRSNNREFWKAGAAAERERLQGSVERRRAERERASMVAAVEQTAEEIVITDVDGNIQYCNPSFERLTGYSRTEVIGQNPRFLKSGEHDAEFYRHLWSTIVTGGIWTGRFTNRKKDGSHYQAEGSISPIYDVSGNLTGFVSATRDVTGRLRMEEQLRQAQKMEGIGRLAGGVAHDFNNLLTVIAGYSGLLEEKLTGEGPLLDYAKQITRASGQAASLTKQLLTFSRKQIIKPKPLDLNILTGGMKQMLQRLVGEDIEVITALAPSLGMVRADADQMSQILINLAANARDAMPGGGRLFLRTANVDPGQVPVGGEVEAIPGPAVLLSVGDTGIGMSYQTRQNIFEPFFTTKERGRGTGLGLSTVYGIVKQNGGYIDVQSEPGKGANFSIYLPRIDECPGIRGGEDSAAGRVRGSETILVVEDHEGVRGLIVGTLELCGFRILQAADGRAALRQSKQYAGTIDLLLTDVIMPGMNGKEVADQLRALRPGIRVLFMSGYSGELIAHRGVLDAGVDYLAKPFTPDALAAKVRAMLGSENQARPGKA
jgi:two-component system, cell cycle sensor histidine kinase and response regulator CckA